MSRKCPSCGTEYSDDISFCGNDATITIQVQDPSDVDPRLGSLLGEYLVVARVADGAMGRVYEGRHPHTRARVAIKVLHPDVAQDSVAVERFKREADTAKSIAHPHIVHVHDFGQTPDASYFLTMEYLQGEELGNLLRREGALTSPVRIVRIVSQIARSLDHAHSFGVIHRDLKPDNIFLCFTPEGDVVKVLDFGSVKLQMETGPKLTAFGTTLGSPYYMSPEQAMGRPDVDQRTDVFALTAILYEMLTGRIAFEAPNVAQILMKIMNQMPDAPTQLGAKCPPALDDVVEKGLRKDKKIRYGSAGEVANAMCTAYGVEANFERWATTPQDELAKALGAAVPPPPRPFDQRTLPPPAGGKAAPKANVVVKNAPQPSAPMHSPSSGDPFEAPRPKGMNSGLLLALGGGAVVILLLAAAAVFFLTR